MVKGYTLRFTSSVVAHVPWTPTTSNQIVFTKPRYLVGMNATGSIFDSGSIHYYPIGNPAILSVTPESPEMEVLPGQEAFFQSNLKYDINAPTQFWQPIPVRIIDSITGIIEPKFSGDANIEITLFFEPINTYL